MTNDLYLLSIKTLSFIQTGTKVKGNSDIQKDYKSKHIQNSTLQHCAYISNYLSFFIFTTTSVEQCNRDQLYSLYMGIPYNSLKYSMYILIKIYD